jgi:hypothetical protein
MTEPSASSLKSVAWFPAAGSPKPEGGAASTLGKLAVGGVFGLALFLAHKPTAAIVVWSISGGVAAVSLASAAARRAIDGALARFGRGVGSVLGAVLLSIVYVVVVTPTRFVRRLLGADDLHLRDVDRPTYWLPCDTDERKAKYVGSMFATEVRTPGGHPVRTALVVLIALFLLAEGILRTQGFGHTVLYVADPEIGYYPEPNVDLVRYGGAVHTNSFGMRSPNVTEKKPAGTFRILMLGDSTLYGGSYIDQEDLYASRVRKALNAPGAGAPGPVEVLAMGCNGWGPFHEHAFVERSGTFDADVVMIQLPIDDINRPLYGLMSVPFFSVQSPPTLALEEVMNHLMWRYRSAHAGLDEAYEAKQSQHGIKEYGALVDDLKGRGTEVMMFVLPTRSPGMGGEESPRESRWRGQLERTVVEKGAKAFFAKGHFAGKGNVDAIYHDNVHLEVPGHHLYAEFIQAKLQGDSARWKQWAGGAPSNKVGVTP